MGMAPLRYERSGDASARPLAAQLGFNFSRKVAKNRLMKASMAEGLATWSATNPEERGIPTPELIEVYKRYGEQENGFGIINTGNIDIEFDHLDGAADMVITPECPLEGSRFEAFRALASAAKVKGSLIVGQVTHPGRQVDSRINANAVSASEVQLEPKMGMTFGKPHAATKEEIARIIAGFAHAAAYLEGAGFDGIELHGAHGYLLAQFLSRTTNKRTDEYGAATMQDRTRLLQEVAAAIKARVSPSFMLAAKLNSVEFQDGGVTPDEARELCAALADAQLDFVEISGGTYEELGMDWGRESSRRREAFFLEFAEVMVAGLGNGPQRRTKAYIVGGLRSVAAMVEALDVVDGVSVGRPAAQEPRLAADILEGRVKGAIRPMPAIENDFGLGMVAAGVHLRQVARGQEPFDASDPAAVEGFLADVNRWFAERAAGGGRLEAHGYFDLTGAVAPYGTVPM